MWGVGCISSCRGGSRGEWISWQAPPSSGSFKPPPLQKSWIRHCHALINVYCLFSERELVMDLERLKLAKTVKPKKSRDKVNKLIMETLS